MEVLPLKKNYFDTFDALRCISLVLVFLQHCAIPNTHFLKAIAKGGNLGVTFFFTLSGFLIGYLLLKEKEKNHHIDLKYFFIKRILRIWPLYFAMVIFAFCSPFILEPLQIKSSSEGYTPHWLTSIFFVENYKMMYLDNFPNATPLRVMWSLCIEEHFYIIWGLMFYFLPIKHSPKFFLGGCVLGIIVRVFYQHYDILPLDIFAYFDYFCFGSIVAYLFVKKKEQLIFLEKIPIWGKYLFAFLIFFLLIYSTHYTQIQQAIWKPTLFGICFSVILLFSLPYKNSIKITENHFLSKIGKYSYGMYLFHTIFLIGFTKIGEKYGVHWGISSIFAFVTTLLASQISYDYFEFPFLKLREKFRRNIQ